MKLPQTSPDDASELRSREDPPCLSIVIPTSNEEAQIHRILERTLAEKITEVIVVDGGSTDKTREIASAYPVRVLRSTPGRANQMNTGAAAASSNTLLFLHADTLPQPGFAEEAINALRRPGVIAGAFDLAIDSDSAALRLIEKCVAWRSRKRRMPYGDQGLFLSRSTFEELGGFPEMPALEDYEFLRRLRRRGEIAIAPLSAVTSARRWRERGIWRTTALNQFCILAYRAGIPIKSIARWLK